MADTVSGRPNQSGTRGGRAGMAPLPLALKEYNYDNEQDFRRRLEDILRNARTSANESGVLSVFGRYGHIEATLDDYLASLVDNDSSVSGATVKDALNTLGTAGGTYLLKASNLSDVANATTARNNLGAQASDALLTSIAGLTFGADSYIYGTGSDTAAAGTITAFGRSLVDDADADAGRATLVAEELGIARGINTQTASYILDILDAGKIVEMDVGSANDLTVPPNSDEPFEIGTYINFTQYGAGKTTLVPGSGVTIRSASGLRTVAQYAVGSLYKRGTNEWVAGGNLMV